MEIIYILCAFFLVLPCYGNKSVYGEDVDRQHLVQAVYMYIQTNRGDVPRSWGQLQEVADLGDMMKYYKSRGVRIEDKYAFVNAEIDVPRLGKTKVVMVRTAPISSQNSDVEWRWFVYAMGGRPGGGNVTEPEAEKMFADAGLELPGKGAKADNVTFNGGYVSGEAMLAPSPIRTPLRVDNTSVSHSPAPAGSPATVKMPEVATKPSSSALIVASIVLVVVFAGVFILVQRRRK